MTTTQQHSETSAHKGAEKLAWINERLAAGWNVYLSTYTNSTVITPKTLKRWKDAGQELFRVDANDSLYIRSGKRWNCIDYSALNSNGRA